MCNYKGMLYPLQLEPPKKETLHLETLDLECPKFLVDLCAEKIVLDGSSTLRATEAIPAELCYSLMKAALLNTRDRAIEVRSVSHLATTMSYDGRIYLLSMNSRSKLCNTHR